MRRMDHHEKTERTKKSMEVTIETEKKGWLPTLFLERTTKFGNQIGNRVGEQNESSIY
jgi:hypothetical protein